MSASLRDGINEGLKLATIEKDGRVVSISICGSGAALLVELQQLAAAAGEALPDKETYYDADHGGWDMEGMASDIEGKKEAAAAAVA